MERLDMLKRFSKAEIDRHEAMRALALDHYGDILDLIGQHGLELYRLPDDQLKPMVDALNEGAESSRLIFRQTSKEP